MPTAEIRTVRTDLTFDIQSEAGTLVARDLTASHPVRWFVPDDGGDPVCCPQSMRKARLSVIAEHCERGESVRWQTTVPWL
jgi:hypothetical protein